jgi:hypothetical protein
MSTSGPRGREPQVPDPGPARRGQWRREDDNGSDDRKGMVLMSGGDFTSLLPPAVPIEELAGQQGVRPFRASDDVRADLWDSDEEFEAFLADVRASRQDDLA